MIDRNDLSERSPRKAVDDTEMVPDDDAVIGRAFRWSLAVLVVFGVVAGVVLVIANRPQELAPPVPAGPIKIVVPVRAADPPSVVFTDITSDAGIDFVHTNGAAGDKLLPETMGGGCAFLDYDGDGDQDLLFVNSSHWPDHPSGDGPPATMALYRNDGTGRFEDVTAEAGLDVGFYGMGVAAGDYDNDGDVDLFLTAVGPDHLYRNDDGVFTDVTRRAGTGGDPDGWSTSSGFFDYDNDGDLDLFVCNYVRWSREIDFAVDFRLTGIGRAYGPPSTFEGTFASLYRNNGDGTFTDVSAESGIEVVNAATGVAVGKALAVVFIDIDRDGWMDIFFATPGPPVSGGCRRSAPLRASRTAAWALPPARWGSTRPITGSPTTGVSGSVSATSPTRCRRCTSHRGARGSLPTRRSAKGWGPRAAAC